MQQNNRSELIKQFIQRFEKERDILIIFCAETGSRGYGTDVETSDSDIKGFFLRKNEKYLKVQEFKEQYTSHKIYLDEKKEIEIDYTFMNLKYFLERKATPGNIDQINLWLQSKAIYKNLLSEQHFSQIQNSIKLPYYSLKGHIKGIIREFSKAKQLEPKQVLNSFVYSLMILNMEISFKMPPYSLYDNLDFLLQYYSNNDSPSPLINLDFLKQVKDIILLAHKLKREGSVEKIIDKGHIDLILKLLNYIKDIKYQYDNQPEITIQLANDLYNMVYTQIIQ